MADLGATVIKVESPDGDDTRKWGPPFIERDEDRSAAYFYSCNRGKLSVTADFKDADDLAFVKDLAALFSSMPDDTVAPVEQARFFVHYLRARALPVGRGTRRLTRRVARRAARMRKHVPRTPVGDAARPKDVVP